MYKHVITTHVSFSLSYLLRLFISGEKHWLFWDMHIGINFSIPDTSKTLTKKIELYTESSYVDGEVQS